MPFQKGHSGNPDGKPKGTLSKVNKQVVKYAHTLREQLQNESFTFSEKVVECWDDIKRIEKDPIHQNEKGSLAWTPLDVVHLKIKFLQTVAGYIYPRLGQIDIKTEGGSGPKILVNVNMPPGEQVERIEELRKRLIKDPAKID